MLLANALKSIRAGLIYTCVSVPLMTESTAAPEPSLSALYQAHRGWLQRRLGDTWADLGGIGDGRFLISAYRANAWFGL
jgi:RNA polymerase sigma-70 factor (ECF subfamily)